MKRRSAPVLFRRARPVTGHNFLFSLFSRFACPYWLNNLHVTPCKSPRREPVPLLRRNAIAVDLVWKGNPHWLAVVSSDWNSHQSCAMRGGGLTTSQSKTTGNFEFHEWNRMAHKLHCDTVKPIYPPACQGRSNKDQRTSRVSRKFD